MTLVDFSKIPLGEIETLLAILRDMINSEKAPCRFDHHGYCQEHGWFGDDPGECGIRIARELMGMNK